MTYLIKSHYKIPKDSLITRRLYKAVLKKEKLELSKLIACYCLNKTPTWHQMRARTLRQELGYLPGHYLLPLINPLLNNKIFDLYLSLVPKRETKILEITKIQKCLCYSEPLNDTWVYAKRWEDSDWGLIARNTSHWSERVGAWSQPSLGERRGLEIEFHHMANDSIIPT